MIILLHQKNNYTIDIKFVAVWEWVLWNILHSSAFCWLLYLGWMKINFNSMFLKTCCQFTQKGNNFWSHIDFFFGKEKTLLGQLKGQKFYWVQWFIFLIFLTFSGFMAIFAIPPEKNQTTLIWTLRIAID